MQPTQAVILDLGNVLAFHDNAKLFKEMAKCFQSTPEDIHARLDGELWERANKGLLPGDALRRELVARLGHEVSPEAWFAVWNCHFTINEAMVRHVEKLVGKVRLVLLSNTHDQHVAWLRPRLPILERFDGLVLSCEEGLMKPEKAIYARALAVAGVDASQASFFDDVERYAAAAAQVGIAGRVFKDAADFPAQLAELGIQL